MKTSNTQRWSKQIKSYYKYNHIPYTDYSQDDCYPYKNNIYTHYSYYK